MENYWEIEPNYPVAVWYLLASSTLSWSAGGMLLKLLDKQRAPGD